MSDIRLTSSETKMKINLCIFLLCNTAVSVFGEPQELKGIVGKSIEFPAAVKKGGNLIYSGVTIGVVTSGRFTRARSKFNGRLQWDSSTGLFSISGLRLEDSGVFTVQNSDEPRSVYTFSLTVNAVELNGVKNKSIVFPTKVETSGNLMNSRKTVIGRVNSRKLLDASEYKGRVHWDSNTGHFSLSGLRLNDSGIYTVENTDGQSSVSTFNLTVWEDNVNVSKPHVSVTHNEFPCTLLCTAERGTGVTLSWYREGQKKPYGSYPVRSAPDLYLPQTVHKGGIYTCEAKNSVSNEKASITVEAHCTDGAAGIWQTEGSKMWSLCLVLIVMLYSRLV